MIGAMYVLYGPLTTLTYTVRKGVHEFVLDDDGEFVLQEEDIMMPEGMDGLEATRILKNDPETKDCPIIMLTGKGQKTDIKIGLEAGADDYFVKPFSPLGLIKKVEQVLG